MNKYFTQLLLIAILLTGCGPAILPPPPTATVTQTIAPSETPSPTQTSIPSATPYPSLQTEGPYLLFTYDDQNFPLKNFTIMDADGSGRKQFQLPNDGYTFQLNKSVSPDGNWLAYFTGSTEEPYDIALNLFDLSDESTQPISNLLAQGFPANLEPIVEKMVLGDPPIYYVDCFEDMECRRTLIQGELTNSLFSLDWSPDSQSIAFTAQIDGPSSDIYIYDVADKTIRQLTNELLNIYKINWAPNGQKILYEISSPLGNISEGREFHLVNLDGKEISFTEESIYKYLHWDGYDWISDNLYLILKSNDVEPNSSDFRVLSTDTGQVKDIWPHSAEFFAVDHENKAVYLAFRHYYGQSALPAEGIYIVESDGSFRKIIDKHLLVELIESQKPYQVLGVDVEGRVYDIRYDGSYELLEWGGFPIPVLSPNGKLLLYREYKKIELYTNSYQPIKSWQIEDEDDLYNVSWRPDSLGLFIFTDTNLYYLPVPDGELHPLLNNCPSKRCEYVRFIWLP